MESTNRKKYEASTKSKALKEFAEYLRDKMIPGKTLCMKFLTDNGVRNRKRKDVKKLIYSEIRNTK